MSGVTKPVDTTPDILHMLEPIVDNKHILGDMLTTLLRLVMYTGFMMERLRPNNKSSAKFTSNR